MNGVDERDAKAMFAQRLKELRKNLGLTQHEFIKDFTDYTLGITDISISTLSSWEGGKKAPNDLNVFVALATYFNVTLDYLMGKSDDAIVNDLAVVLCKEPVGPIASEKLKEYDQKPIFVEFVKNDKPSIWGIYAASENLFYTTGGKVKNSALVRCYAMRPPRVEKKRIVSINELVRTADVYVEYYGSDEGINEAYTGWYKHNKHNELINVEGRILPYAGLEKVYLAYSKH